MKNRNLTFILFLSVIVIWGMLIFRIRSSLEPKIETNIEHVVQSDPASSSIQIDYVEIDDKHRDPFTGIVTKPKLRNPTDKSNISSKPRLSSESDSLIKLMRYAGLISSGSPKSRRIIVEFNNREHLLNLNDSLGGFKLFFVSRDSIGLSSLNRKYYLKSRN